ncbi:methyl-accepting chemotaxis protein [Xanthomonas euvesicatoria pv. eucalypti]|uniref:methyl-accepting chemotaxis protein n=1 Tax=Xanthomonas euvesicatoria TaxID=456327 RepID=UPI0026E26B06|nr:methyl-accepting chemotaxis protein [Xanthomonas euvesicatoria]MDO7932801.1 methyl-accepting chemotaxis protein [Xanthomonas euvesicatoria pv. eucalypti]MDO7938605.1 methyl-accepting chemotaxis protein [Xanthomonas euvesicatoria pv. eucalypti]MDO7941392.1 methyl-accepting chemotaxis protein [Xanthomonas euvesicatoria pv. eucalypti]MDO7947545.1 methyl-accepting chemotaxis protein [Xanthomonas euvesicatoria pv. eucalypti]MDO7954917.1 methyl-accepting chemotaxis protein [Xanthomonas euvesicato
MHFFPNLRIGQRLALGFLAIIVLMVILTVVGIQRVRSIDQQLTAINEVNSVKQRYAINFRGSVHDRAIALRDVVLMDDPAERHAAEQSIDKLAADYARAAQPLDDMIASSTDAKEKDILRQIKSVEQRTLPLIAQVRAFRDAADKAQAEQHLLQQARPAFIAWLASINAFIDLQEAKNRQAARQAVATARGFAMLMVMSTVVALLLGATIAFLLTRSVVLPLRQSLRLAQRINDGDLRSQDAATGNDESGQLLRAMQQMQRRLQEVIWAQRSMAARHDAGEISYRTDPQGFPGEYGDMVQDTNALVHAHVQTQLRMTQVMGSYAIGDLTQDIEQYPGEKSAITATMQQVKRNLQAINAQIQELTQAACAGDFALRGKEETFEHDFRLMVENLNTMMATSDTNLASFSGLLRAIADGDLTVRMSGNFHGVFASMRDDANSTVHRLTDIVTRIQTTSNSISFAAEDIASGNQQLAQRSEQQAASLEETAASMEELTSTVKQNAEHATRANQLARGAAAIASEGRDVVGQVIEQMSGIEASSRRIADIISVIDGIAFQTNILALNAAVEAARAGEQGRGFAVVASEVRTLSHRSSDAAKEIKRLIDDSVQRVADGSTLVHTAGTTMGEIVTSVQHVTDIMAHISAASQEQAGSIEQVNHTIAQMDETTQHNVRLVEAASTAAHALEQHSAQLTRAVEVFKVNATVL